MRMDAERIHRMVKWLMYGGCRLMEDYLWLMVNNSRSMYDDRTLVIHKRCTLNHDRSPVNYDVRSMVNLWWRMVNYRRTSNNNRVLLGACFRFLILSARKFNAFRVGRLCVAFIVLVVFLLTFSVLELPLFTIFIMFRVMFLGFITLCSH